ncbi:Protein translocase subunit SecE [Rickettsiales endosymbiont of Paramecium tredecaurelia]|uniref:preprotein translocase subunit SecE n=1 Tax=Candidatus Sarmatiella mevalonica TaxID=2770581 RepID=UPI001924F5ED|nr:Protein translocase subunit SecE [Candidatus Sarmatiella mevalonica]
MFKKVHQFLGEVRAEAVKIVWPNLAEMKSSVLLVCIIVFAFSLVCLLCDYLIHALVKFLLAFSL